MFQVDTKPGFVPEQEEFALLKSCKTVAYVSLGRKYCLRVTQRRLTYLKTETEPKIIVKGHQFCSQANQRLLVKESVMSCKNYIAYFRVSTFRQGNSGLGIDAQRAATEQFVMSCGGKLLSEYTEVESGRLKNRPQLKYAIDNCRKTGATLLIAKLDRLARNVAFIANLIESGVKFTAVDMPSADRFMLHVYAAMAEEEGRRISERTKAALAAAKARGVELGKNGKILSKKHKNDAVSFALKTEPIPRKLIECDRLTFRAAAEQMNAIGVPTARGGDWHSTSVFRVWNRVIEANNA